jgi:formyl-CoA transferase
VRHREVLTPLLRAEFMKQDRQHWVAALEAAGVPCGPINSIDEVFADPQLQHRQMVVELPHPTSGTVRLVGSPMRFTEQPAGHERAPPLLGEHTVEVLSELGLDAASIAELAAHGIT